jgi:hypothetical protein
MDCALGASKVGTAVVKNRDRTDIRVTRSTREIQITWRFFRTEVADRLLHFVFVDLEIFLPQVFHEMARPVRNAHIQ